MPSPDFADPPDRAATRPTLIGSWAWPAEAIRPTARPTARPPASRERARDHNFFERGVIVLISLKARRGSIVAKSMPAVTRSVGDRQLIHFDTVTGT